MSEDPRHYLRVAAQALQARDRDAVAEAIRRLLQSRSPLGASWATVAKMAAGIAEPNLAIEAQKNLVAALPEAPEHHHALAASLMTYGRVEDAIAIGRKLADRDPRLHSAAHFLGTAYSTLGRGEEAMRWFRRALEIEPNAPATWLSLAQQKRFNQNDLDLRALRAAVKATPPFPKEARGTMLYALGKALDDIQDYDGAFDAYEKGARMMAEAHPYDSAASEALVNDLTARWDRGFASRLTQSNEQSDRVAFVIGLPRSGTTLVEQILVSHSAFSEGAETGVFSKAALALPNLLAESVVAADADPRWQGQLWTRIGCSYLHLMNERFGSTGKLVDKTLGYTRHVGAIVQALPKAKFIWLRREPGAIAWSCFRTRFADGLEWSWSLADIGRHFRLEDRLFAHWTKQFPDRILPLQYEELVKEPDRVIPRIFSFLGLPDEKATRNFHDVDRVVRTASVAQVRQPLYTGSVSGWRAYEAKMRPFFEAYQGKG